MATRALSSRRVILLAFAFAGSGGSSGCALSCVEPLGLKNGLCVPQRAEVVAGDGQSGAVGRPLRDTLIARFWLGSGEAAAGRPVFWGASWRVLGSAEQVAESLSYVTLIDKVTDPAGRARAVWTLGPEAGAYAVDAVMLIDLDASPPPGPGPTVRWPPIGARVTFHATAVPASPPASTGRDSAHE